MKIELQTRTTRPGRLSRRWRHLIAHRPPAVTRSKLFTLDAYRPQWIEKR